eukprot:3552015-Rhodomonas_salina.1
MKGFCCSRVKPGASECMRRGVSPEQSGAACGREAETGPPRDAAKANSKPPHSPWTASRERGGSALRSQARSTRSSLAGHGRAMHGTIIEVQKQQNLVGTQSSGDSLASGPGDSGSISMIYR